MVRQYPASSHAQTSHSSLSQIRPEPAPSPGEFQSLFLSDSDREWLWGPNVLGITRPDSLPVKVQPLEVAHHQPRIVHERLKSIPNVNGRPGKKPEARYEPDPIKLEALCLQRGGTEFACQWIPIVFKDGVTREALLRRLNSNEIEIMNFRGGFEPSLAYEGFLQVAEGGFECCLCTVGKRVSWKHKKDAVRHFRKFHFGLADECITWCVMYRVLMYLSGFSN